MLPGGNGVSSGQHRVFVMLCAVFDHDVKLAHPNTPTSGWIVRCPSMHVVQRSRGLTHCCTSAGLLRRFDRAVCITAAVDANRWIQSAGLGIHRHVEPGNQAVGPLVNEVVIKAEDLW